MTTRRRPPELDLKEQETAPSLMSEPQVTNHAQLPALYTAKRQVPRKRRYPRTEQATRGAQKLTTLSPLKRTAEIRLSAASQSSQSRTRPGPGPGQTKREQTLSPKAKFRQAVEKMVKTLWVSASPQGAIWLRSELQEAVFQELSFDVEVVERQIFLSFYTRDDNTRRLIQGHERELRLLLERKGLKLKSIHSAPTPKDPEEAQPVQLYSSDT